MDAKERICLTYGNDKGGHQLSDTILQSNDVMDSRRGDIVVGVDGSDESFAALR